MTSLIALSNVLQTDPQTDRQSGSGTVSGTVSKVARSQVFPRPFLKWAGGKGQLLEQYSAFIPRNFATYYEPFLGGGAIFFHLQPQHGVLMDINPELVNVYACVRDDVEAVIAILHVHQEHHCECYYYDLRSQHHLIGIERAARLIYLNKTCYNGLYRENSKGQFNVPMGRYRKPTICNPVLLRSVSQALKSAKIYLASFTQVLENAISAQDFVYFDPPYYPISATSNFTSYNRYNFHQKDQERLHETFVQLAQRGVQVMLSNSDCSFIRNLYQDFNIHTIYANRSINSKVTKRGKIKEVLVTSY